MKNNYIYASPENIHHRIMTGHRNSFSLYPTERHGEPNVKTLALIREGSLVSNCI